MRSLVHASTSLLRSRSDFVHLIDSLHHLPGLKNHVLLFSLSHNSPDLEQSVKRLSSCTARSIGCLSGPLPSKLGYYSCFSCSIAIFERNSCVPFSTVETGIGPIRVGRWHAYDKRNTNSTHGEVWEHDLSGRVDWDDIRKDAGSERFVPQELENVRDTRTLLYFSDNSSWELATALRRHLPQASQLGVIASATPFITGHPFTLLRDGRLQSSGAVGIALTMPPAENVMAFEGVERLTGSVTIKRSEGNLIHELENGLPAQILLKAIQDHELPNESAKEIDYYIGLNEAEDRQPPRRLLKIIAGSPTRGLLAVEEMSAPPPGTRIEFFYRQRASSARLSANAFYRKHHQSGSVIGAFVDVPENTQSSAQPTGIEDSPTGLSQTYDSKSSFTVSTEYGFTTSSASPPEIWKCTVPGSFGGFRFSEEE